MRGSEPTIPTLPDGIRFSTVAERFGWNLRIARRRAGLTQQDLADRVGANQSGISLWERGRGLASNQLHCAARGRARDRTERAASGDREACQLAYLCG